MKILPFEEMNYKDGEICIDEVSVTYVQKEDCTEPEGNVQALTVSCRNNGIARFINIKTNEEGGWSIDSEDELKDIIQDFKVRAEIK